MWKPELFSSADVSPVSRTERMAYGLICNFITKHKARPLTLPSSHSSNIHYLRMQKHSGRRPSRHTKTEYSLFIPAVNSWIYASDRRPDLDNIVLHARQKRGRCPIFWMFGVIGVVNFIQHTYYCLKHKNLNKCNLHAKHKAKQCRSELESLRRNKIIMLAPCS